MNLTLDRTQSSVNMEIQMKMMVKKKKDNSRIKVKMTTILTMSPIIRIYSLKMEIKMIVKPYS